MAYLGAVGVPSEGGSAHLVWSFATIAYVLLPEVIGQYQSYGGYVYVG